jgi:hypothetical protein
MNPLEHEIREALVELARREQAKRRNENSIEEELKKILTALAHQMHADDSECNALDFDRMAENVLQILMESGRGNVTSGELVDKDLRRAIAREMNCDEEKTQEVLNVVAQFLNQFRLR